MEEFPLHYIPLLPLAGAAFCLLFGKRVGKTITTAVALCSVFGSGLLVASAVRLLHESPVPLTDTFFSAPWISAGDLQLSAGLTLDRLSSVLCMIVTGIGFLIHVYASGYMAHDEGYTRFFGYLNLFMGAMLILVLGDSMPVTFVGWEGVGLCSYLLIGFWYDKEANANAGRKAFVVNRIGDFGFLLAMAYLFSLTGTLKYAELPSHLQTLGQTAWWGLPAAFFFGILVLVGATGKSAQIPLYVWLPDAMAGPTPVSALIHAATMVTAGVYVCVRLHVAFEIFPLTLAIIAIIGALTALFAATIGVLQRDFKKVLAYSTVSQLGFMFVGVGSAINTPTSVTSNYQGAIFHLMTHAFFKAGLFLGAGSVMHALSGEGDITRMGGLRKHLPHTHATFLLCCLAIAGIIPLSGFWSKDAILGGAHAAMWLPKGTGGAEVFFAHHLGLILYLILLATAACTAFYMFRLYFLAFWGEFRGTDEELHHIHESPASMTGVLWVLAIGAVGVGFLGIPDVVSSGGNHFGEWLLPVVREQAAEESAREFWTLAVIALGASAAGIGLAAALYLHGFSDQVRAMAAAFPSVYKFVYNKYYIDEFYNAVIVQPLRWISLGLWKVVDSFFIDGTVRLVGGLTLVVGKVVRYAQTGDVHHYVAGMLAGAALVFGLSVQLGGCHGYKFAEAASVATPRLQRMPRREHVTPDNVPLLPAVPGNGLIR